MEHIGTGHTDPDHQRGLTEGQLATFAYVAVAPALSEGARLASIGRTTLHRRVDDAHFRRALEAISRVYQGGAVGNRMATHRIRL